MNEALGSVVSAVMVDENQDYYFVQPARNGQTYRLAKSEAPQVLHIGGSVKGFVYENADHQLQMTCAHIPTVQVDHYDFGTVVGVRRDLGVFVDIGLPNKDIVVSLDDLPNLSTYGHNRATVYYWPCGSMIMIGYGGSSRMRKSSGQLQLNQVAN